MYKSNDGMLYALRTIANGECYCTPKQQTGEDYTVCISCMAGSALNYIGEYIRDEYNSVINTKEDNNVTTE